MKGNGLGLLVLLIAMLLAAFLFISNLGSLGMGQAGTKPEEAQVVQETQEMVDGLNRQIDDRTKAFDELT